MITLVFVVTLQFAGLYHSDVWLQKDLAAVLFV